MLKNLFIKLLLIISLVAVQISLVSATEYAGAFMELGAGAEAAAMGQAQVAAVNDAYAGYWNPAALSRLEGMDANSSFGSYYNLVNYKVYNFAHNYGGGALAVSYLTAQVDSIAETTYSDGRIWETGEDFGYGSSVLALSHSSDLSGLLGKPTNNLLWGLTLKFIGEGFSDRAGASATALDLGLYWQATEYIGAGLVVRNAGKTYLQWDSPSENKETIATDYALGLDVLLRPTWHWTLDFNYKAGQQEWQVNTGIAYDAWQSEDQSSTLTIRTGSNNGNPTVGLGLLYYDFKIDYAYVSAPDIFLEASHLLSLGFYL